MIQQFFEETFGSKSICLLGFGREGKSSYRVLRKFLPRNTIFIADSNPEINQHFLKEFGQQEHVFLYTGQHYMQALEKADLIIKSPGISTKSLVSNPSFSQHTLLSQTGIFLRLFRKQIIGVTGTKGKSTTVSLLHHIFSLAQRDVLLAGNIGIPPFELLDKITDQTVIIYEMSSHQLEHLTISPSTAILLNIFQEHLDHYNSYEDYQLAKMNIARWQDNDDIFVYNGANSVLKELVPKSACSGIPYLLNGFGESGRGVECQNDDLIINTGLQKHVIKNVCSHRKLKGEHNLLNIGAAALVAHLNGIEDIHIQNAVASFSGLAHRLEFICEWNGISFYNDSISTIPEATIEAIKTFPATQTLILGGYDRGVDYKILIDFLPDTKISNLVLIGKAGKRILEEYHRQIPDTKQCFWFNSFDEAVLKSLELTKPGGICLLSPAASSYDMFKNFEERGDRFREIISGL